MYKSFQFKTKCKGVKSHIQNCTNHFVEDTFRPLFGPFILFDQTSMKPKLIMCIQFLQRLAILVT